MKPIVRNIIAVAAGIIGGGAINMCIVMISGKIIPPPPGADLTTMEGLKASMHLMEPKHFILPFLAHALGTFAGSILTAKIAYSRTMQLAMIVGMVNLIGGISNIFMLPGPVWFNVIDVTLAYLPMAYIGAMIIMTSNKRGNPA